MNDCDKAESVAISRANEREPWERYVKFSTLIESNMLILWRSFMKFEFKLIKNVHMYNHVLVCTYGEESFELICESAPGVKNTINFWLDDINLTTENKEKFRESLFEWCESQDFICQFNKGKRA